MQPNPVHVQYATSVPDRELNTRKAFFQLLDSLDEFERDRILQVAIYGLHGLRPDHDPSSTMESNCARYYENFRFQCESLPGTDDFVVHAIVNYILAWLCRQSDEDQVAGAVERQRALLKEIESRTPEGMPADQVDHAKAFVEETVNNADAERDNARRRYELFCNRVVRHLLKNGS